MPCNRFKRSRYAGHIDQPRLLRGGVEDDGGGGGTAAPTPAARIHRGINDLKVAIHRVAPVLASACREVKSDTVRGGVGPSDAGGG